MKPWFRASFALMLALLLGSELIVRLFFARNMSGRFAYGYHPTAGFVETPGGTVNLVRAGGRRFHPQSFQRARPAGVFRVMVVGDSVARGPSLSDAYPSLIAEQLRARGVPAEGINLAVGGYGARRKEIVLRQALEYQPSLVVLHVNESNEFEDEREWRRSEEFQSWHPKNWLMKSLALRRLYEAKTENIFWQWLPSAIRAQKEVSDADAELSASADAATVREWDERVRRHTAECVACCRARGVPILLVSQATFEKDPQGKSRLNDYGLDALAESLAGDGVLTLSMKQVLSSRDFASLYSDGSHLRREGHEALATAIAEKLRSVGLVR
ncbi:MAG: hypothetical protein HY300_17755 [Verrucomicrobia bacterium]|nr:hypothetical protein [Verrucomicrobiota bacterium]